MLFSENPLEDYPDLFKTYDVEGDNPVIAFYRAVVR